MLLRQNFGRRHQRDLKSVLHGDNRGFKGDDRLTRADVPLQQAAHGKGLPHIGSDFFQHSFLRSRGMKRQNFFNSLAHGVIKAECDPGLGFLLAAF